MPDLPPSQKVLLTTELAEQILSHLPFQSLICAELVCKTWYTIISWSHHTRQGLFLEPSKHALSMPYQSNAKLRKPTQWRSLNVRRYRETYTIAILHPWLENLRGLERTGMIAFTLRRWRRALEKLHEEHSCSGSGGGSGGSSAGRWRQMFITQPPCRNVKIEFSITTHNGAFTGREYLKCPQGVTLGLLVGKLRELFDDPGRVGEFQPGYFPEGVRAKRDRSRADFERLDCFVDGFITEAAAFALASRAAAAACATAVGS